jgi:K+-sensing histidine kinase KdpD
MSTLVERTLDVVRSPSAATASRSETFSLADFVADANNVAALHAQARGCGLVVPAVDPLLKVRGVRELLLAALVNVLHNAFKFTQVIPRSSLSVRSTIVDVYIDVEDCCGGLPPGVPMSCSCRSRSWAMTAAALVLGCRSRAATSSPMPDS